MNTPIYGWRLPVQSTSPPDVVKWLSDGLTDAENTLSTKDNRGYAQGVVTSFAVPTGVPTTVPIVPPDASGLTVASNTITFTKQGWWHLVMNMMLTVNVGAARTFLEAVPSGTPLRTRNTMNYDQFVTVSVLTNRNSGSTMTFNILQSTGASVNVNGDWYAKYVGAQG